MIHLEAEAFQAFKCEVDHNRRSAQYRGHAGVEFKFLRIGRYKAHVPVPAFFLTVDGQVYIHVFFVHPLFGDFFIGEEVFLCAGSVHNRQMAVVFTVCPTVVDDGTDRSKSDAAGNEQKVLAPEFRVHREAVSVRSADADLLADFHAVKPAGQLSDLLDTKFLILLYRRR